MSQTLKNAIRSPLTLGALGVSAVVLVGLVAPSFAQHHGHGQRGPRGPQMMEGLDTNSDGTLERAEADATIAGRLETFDADENGTLSLEEYEGLWLEVRRQRMIRAFQELDSNGDGQVTVEEAGAPVERMFERMDSNDDGAITQEEIQAARESRRERRGGRRGHGGHGPE